MPGPIPLPGLPTGTPFDLLSSVPSFESSASSAAVSSSNGQFYSGPFNPVFGGSAEQELAKSVVPIGSMLLAGAVLIALIRRN